MRKSQSLAELQELVQTAVQSGAASADLIQVILERPPISTSQRLQIYRDAYMIRLRESLRDDFPKVESALGETQFEEIIEEFIKSHPSRVPNLAEYSAGFPEFVRTRTPQAYLAAVQDWLEIRAQHAEFPEAVASLTEIQNGAPFKIKTMPSTCLQEVGGEFVIAIRCREEVSLLKLEPTELKLLQFLQSERSFDDITEFLQAESLDEEFLTKTIFEWIKNEIIYCRPA